MQCKQSTSTQRRLSLIVWCERRVGVWETQKHTYMLQLHLKRTFARQTSLLVSMSNLQRLTLLIAGWESKLSVHCVCITRLLKSVPSTWPQRSIRGLTPSLLSLWKEKTRSNTTGHHSTEIYRPSLPRVLSSFFKHTAFKVNKVQTSPVGNVAPLI